MKLHPRHLCATFPARAALASAPAQPLRWPAGSDVKAFKEGAKQ